MQKQRKDTAHAKPAFSMTDEIRRNRRMRLSADIRKARKVRQVAVTVIICFGVVISLLLAMCFTLFRVDTVAVLGNERYSAEEVQAALDLRPTDCIFFLDARTVLSRILKTCPYISEVRVEKQYPSAIIVTVAETQAVFSTEMYGGQFLMDADLRVIGQGAPTAGQMILKLPDIHTAVEGETIQFADPAGSAYVFTLVRELLDAEMSITLADVRNRFAISVCIGDTAQILLGDADRIPLKLQVAAEVLKTALAEGSARTKIDVSNPKRVSAAYDYASPFDE